MNKLKRVLTTLVLSTAMLLPQKFNAAAAQSNNATSVKAEKKESFTVWLKKLRRDALDKGISQKTINLALPYTLQPLPRIIELDRKQPESTRTFDEYVEAIVSKKRTDTGLVRMNDHQELLTRVGQAYGLEPEVIVALWGIETNYGTNTGDFSVVQSLATLAYDGRRSEYFRKELFNALRIVDQGHIPLASLKGSWAGAMGQTQFMPTSFFMFAQDFNKDGRKDIWKTHADIFASAANYLHSCGWKKGLKWGQRIDLPEGFDRKLIGLDQTHSIQSLKDKGIDVTDIKDKSAQLSVIQPGGEGTSAFVVSSNYKIIMKWNKSNAFATAVGLLSDKFKP